MAQLSEILRSGAENGLFPLCWFKGNDGGGGGGGGGGDVGGQKPKEVKEICFTTTIPKLSSIKKCQQKSYLV